MDFNKMKSMSTEALRELYNDLTQQDVKRFSSRGVAEKRLKEACVAAGKWEEPNEQAPEPAEAPAPAPKKGAKGKAAPAPAPVVAGAPSKGKKKAPAPAPSKKESPAPAKRTRGAPVKNPTFTAINPKDKSYNPKQFKPQASSDRMIVLEYIRKEKGQRTRDQIEEHFKKVKGAKGGAVNFDAALYFLVKFGFLRSSDQ